MKKRTFWVVTGLLALCLLVSLLLLGRALAGEKRNPEYAVFTAADAVSTRRYDFEPCKGIRFFEGTYENGDKHTVFIGALPTVKVVNDDGYYLELTTNDSVHDVFSASTAYSCTDGCGMLDIELADRCYAPVYGKHSAFAVQAVYVDCTAFAVTIHAPIGLFKTNADGFMDVEMAKAEDTVVFLHGKETHADIHRIDAENLTLYCSGSARADLSGTVAKKATIRADHDSRVNAEELQTGKWDRLASNAIFGFSRIRCADRTVWNPLSLGTILTIGIIGSPFLWLCLLIRHCRKQIPLMRELPSASEAEGEKSIWF